MPRGRKPKQKEPVLSPTQLELLEAYSNKHDEAEALYKDLAKIKQQVDLALTKIGFINSSDSIADAAFKAGRAYGPLDEANDKLEEMLTTLYENDEFNFDHWDDITNN